jgi:hypothetical protein
VLVARKGMRREASVARAFGVRGAGGRGAAGQEVGLLHRHGGRPGMKETHYFLFLFSFFFFFN